MTANEKRKLERELAGLPPGSIVRRVIRGVVRFYHQWREDGMTRSRYLRADEVGPLRTLIERRREIKRILSGRARESAFQPVGQSFRTDVTMGRDLLELAKGVERFKKRDMFPSIMKYLRSDITDRVLVVSGLRRTGKTTMLRQAILALDAAERDRAAYAKMTERDTMPALKADLKILHDAGFRYVFIDEVTLMEDFIDTASVLSDIFAGMGMKIILSGTDSLGFWFAERDELYDRAFTLHTTFIPFREHARLLGTDDVDEYIRFGGTLRAGEILFDHKDAKNDSASFRNDETTRFYIDTAIARNIQRSLRCVDAGRHFRLLIDLYEKGELTNAINRIIEDMNHRFSSSAHLSASSSPPTSKWPPETLRSPPPPRGRPMHCSRPTSRASPGGSWTFSTFAARKISRPGSRKEPSRRSKNTSRHSTSSSPAPSNSSAQKTNVPNVRSSPSPACAFARHRPLSLH